MNQEIDEILVELVIKTYQGEGVPLSESILLEIKKASEAISKIQDR